MTSVSSLRPDFFRIRPHFFPLRPSYLRNGDRKSRRPYIFRPVPVPHSIERFRVQAHWFLPSPLSVPLGSCLGRAEPKHSEFLFSASFLWQIAACASPRLQVGSMIFLHSQPDSSPTPADASRRWAFTHCRLQLSGDTQRIFRRASLTMHDKKVKPLPRNPERALLTWPLQRFNTTASGS